MSNAVAIADARANRTGHQIYAGRSRAIIERSLIALRSSTWVPIATGFVEPVLRKLSMMRATCFHCLKVRLQIAFDFSRQDARNQCQAKPGH